MLCILCKRSFNALSEIHLKPRSLSGICIRSSTFKAMTMTERESSKKHLTVFHQIMTSTFTKETLSYLRTMPSILEMQETSMANRWFDGSETLPATENDSGWIVLSLINMLAIFQVREISAACFILHLFLIELLAFLSTSTYFCQKMARPMIRRHEPKVKVFSLEFLWFPRLKFQSPSVATKKRFRKREKKLPQCRWCSTQKSTQKDFPEPPLSKTKFSNRGLISVEFCSLSWNWGIELSFKNLQCSFA